MAWFDDEYWHEVLRCVVGFPLFVSLTLIANLRYGYFTFMHVIIFSLSLIDECMR